MGTVQDSAVKNDDVTNTATGEINSNPEESDTVNNNENTLQSVSDKGSGDSRTNNNPPLSIDSKNGNNASEMFKDSSDKDSERKNSVTQKNVPVPAISRIARPCVGHQKPAVPVTPTQNNSVLTEDTDGFIIGDKIWVNGTKPGQIAYIGETQFAPGEWAGIVLDAPIGKNDGSVGGTRYFQCEPRRGVFSRLSRLTRAPLPGAEESFTPMSYTHHVSSTPLNNGTRPRGASPLSPTGSTKSLRKSPSLSTSNTSLASTTHVIDFKVGDRVIVKSSQGSKVGILRYMGITSFASGEWCGVELDEPRGKNDGSVEGIRYFECKPQFGLFAPVTKISKSPLKYKPGNCVLHSGAKLPPSGMKRVGSKESMTSYTSMTSSLASAASGARRVRLGVNSLTPQDVLREKQLHIEQLLKERDLERAEFTRAASQADNAEQQLAITRAEYEYYRAECEAKLKEYSTVLSHLNVNRGSLLSQLEDEKKKNEDLQFKFEEAAITKGDIEVNNQSNIHRIKDLEERLALEKQKVELLEQESSKLFEAEEELVKSRDEIDSLKSNLQHLRTKRDTAAQEIAISRETSSVIAQQVETQNLKIESSQSMILNLEKQLEESTKKSTKHLQNCEKYQNEITMLKTELSRTQTLVQEQSSATDNKIKIHSELESSLRTEIERLKSELAGKNAELQSKDQELKEKDDEIRRFKTIIETTEIDLKAKTVDVERYQKSKQESDDSYNKQIDYFKKMLKEKVLEKEEIEKTTTIEITSQKAKLEDASKTIALHLGEIELLKADLIEAKADVERNSLDVHERHTRQIAIKESELMAMAAELQQKNEEISKCSIVTTKLEDDICIKNGVIERLKLELESFKKRSETEERSMLNYTEQMSVLQLNIGDLQRKLASTEQVVLELQEQKARLEDELQNVIASSGDYSTELRKMNAAVLEKELMITTVRNEFLQKLQLQQSNEQQLQLQLQKIQEDSERNDNNLKEKVRILQESEDMLRQRCESANGEAIKIRDDLMIKVNQLQRSVEEKDFALKVSAGDNSETKRYLQEQLDRTTGELQKTIDTCQYKINELSVESINSKNALAQKTQQLIESEAKLKHVVAQTQLNEEELRRLTEEQSKKLQFDLSEKNAQVQQFQTELELLKRDCHSRNIDIGEKDHRISELSVQLENTLKLVNQLQVEKDNLQLRQMEANKQCAVRNQQCTDLLNQVALLSEKAELGDKVAQELQMLKLLHQQLLQQLQITEKQKQNLVSRFEEEAKKNGDADKCNYMLELAKNIQTSANNEHTRKISELQQLIDTTQLKLQESQNQLDTQKGEILSLQNELLSAQQVCGPNTTPSNSVSNKNRNNPIHTQYPLQYPPFLQVQLTNLKNSYADLLQRFVGSQRLNVYLINKLQRAISNGDTRHLHTLLGDFLNLKKYSDALRGTVEQDKFKFQKIISYALLSLHRKQVEINVQNNFIRQLQSIYNSLPTQCKLLQSNTVKGFDLELPNEAQIELEKTIQLIKVKDEHIQNLQVQLGSMQENCRKLFNTKCPIAPTPESQFINGSPQFAPNYCGPSKVIVKNVPVVQYVHKPCQQEYPDYVKNQPIVDQECAPGQTVVQKVPVYVPRIVVKEVPRYVNENFKCPAPQVIYQKIPMPLPPRIVVVTKPVRVESNDADKLQIQQILNHCSEQCAKNKNEQIYPTIQNSLLNQPLQIATLKEQVQILANQLRQCRMVANKPSFVQTPFNCAKFVTAIENQQNELNKLNDNLLSCNRQLGGLYPNAGNQQSHIDYLLSVIENLKSRCLASNINGIPSVTNEYVQCTNVRLQHNTLFTTLASIARDILQLINTNLADTARVMMSKTKLEHLVIQVNKEIVVPHKLLDSPYPGQFAQCKDAIIEQSNQLNGLRYIIRSSLPQLNSVTMSPTAYLNVLRATIKQFLSQLNTDTDWENEAVSSHGLGDYTKCSNLLMQQEARVNILRTVIEGMLRKLNNEQLSDQAKLNVLRAQIENLLLQLNNNNDINFGQCPPARVIIQKVPIVQPVVDNVIPEGSNTFETVKLNMQIQKLIRELHLCRLAKAIPNIGYYPKWNVVPRPGNTLSPSLPQPEAIEQENIYLKNKIQQLLVQLNILDQKCNSKFVDQSSVPFDSSDFKSQNKPSLFYDCGSKDIVINHLRNQVYILKQQLKNSNNNAYPENTFNHQCPPPRVVVEQVPLSQVPSAEQQNEIFILKKHIQNLLMQLRFFKSYPTSASPPDSYEHNLLKLQITKLTQELNYIRLHPKCSSRPADIFNPQCPPPRVVIEKVAVPSPEHHTQILVLKKHIQNLLMQLQFYKSYSGPTPEKQWMVTPTPSAASNEVNVLKLQIFKLTQELNYVRLHNQCLPQVGNVNIPNSPIFPSPPRFDVNYPLPPPTSDNLIAGSQCPPPRIIIRKIPVRTFVGTPVVPQLIPQNKEIQYLNQKIQYLLYQLNRRCDVTSIPQAPCLPQRIEVPVPVPVSGSGVTHLTLINSLNAQIRQLLFELNTARQQVTQFENRCKSSLSWSPLQTGNNEEVAYLKQQIQQLIIKISALQNRPVPIQQENEVTYLRQQVQLLVQKLNLANLHPLIYSKQCVSPKIVISNSIPLESKKEVIVLRQRVQNLLIELNNARLYPNCKIASPNLVMENTAVITSLKNQVLHLLNQLNSVGVSPGTLNIPCQPSPTKTIVRLIPMPQPSPPRTIVKTVIVPQPSPSKTIIKTVPILKQSPPQIIIRPVYVPQPPRTVIKTVYLPQPSRPKLIERPVVVHHQSPPKIIYRPIPVPQSSPERTILKTVYVPRPSAPRTVIKTVPILVSQPSSPRIIVKTVHVPQPSSPRIIVRPVLVSQPGRTIIRPVYIPQPYPLKTAPIIQQSPPRIVIKTVHVPQPSPPRIIIRPVPIPQPSPLKTIVKTVPILQQSPPKIIIRPVPVPQPPRTVIKTVYIPQPSRPKLIERPVVVHHQSPPKIIFRPIPVPQSSPGRTIIKTVYVPRPSEPRTVVKTVPIVVSQPSIPRVIVKTVHVPQPSPPRIIVRPVLVSQPGRTVIRPVYISQPSPLTPAPIIQQSPPRIIIKTVHVPQPSPPRIIIRPVPIPQPSPTFIQQTPVPQPYPPKIVVKTVYVPQPSPLRTIIRLVPGPTRTVIQTLPIYRSSPPRTIIQPVPVPQPSRPRVIVRPVPVFQRSIEKENEIKELRIRLQQLTVQINNAKHYPSYKSCTPQVIVKPVIRPSPKQQTEITILKTQLHNLLLQLNNANHNAGAVHRDQCPDTKVLTERVPVYIPGPWNDEKIQLLQQQIQNLLLQLNSRSSVMEQPDSNFIPTPSRQNQVNILKVQIQNLVTQINNLQKECFNQRQPLPNLDFTRRCATPLVKYIPIIQQPRTVIKEVRIPISQNCEVPKVIIHNVPVPQPPRIIIKNVPVIQPPKIIIKKVPVPLGSSCPPPEIVVQKQPVFLPPKIVLKEVPIIQPPKIIIKEVPVPQAPEIKIKYVPVPVAANCPPPKVIVQRVPVLQAPRTIIKEVATSRPPQIVVKEVSVPQPQKIIIQKVPVFYKESCQGSSPPATIIKEIPVPVPSQSASECKIPKYVIQQVPVVQPPKIIIKTVPMKVPPREVIKMVRVPVVQERTCPPPQVITQRIPVIQTRTVIKEVPISQPPRIIIKQVPVPQTPQIILKKIPVFIGQNVQCPTPQVIVEKIEVPQPPRIIIKQVPVTLPPRVVVQQIPKYIYVPSTTVTNGNVNFDKSSMSNFGTVFDRNHGEAVPPQVIIKEVVVPTVGRSECSPPKVIIHNVPVNQPPRIIVKNVPVVLPPKIIIKTVPVGSNVNCRVPEVVIKSVPVVQPPRTILKEVEVRQPPRIIVKEVPVIRPQVIVKYVPVPVLRNVECPKPKVIIQKVLVPQPPRTIVTEVPVQQQPRVVIKEVFVPRPPQIIVKEVPRIISDGSVSIGDSARNFEEVRTLRLELTDLTNRLTACVKGSFNIGAVDVFENGNVQSLPQCLTQVQKQRIIIHKLSYKLKNFVNNPTGNFANPGNFGSILGGINKGLSDTSFTGRSSFKIPSRADESSRIHLPLAQTGAKSLLSPLNLPLPMLNILKSNPFVSTSKSKQGLQTLLTKVLHEAFTYTQAALSKCMSAVLIQQLATQTDKGVAGWGGNQRLLEEKEMAEGQIQFLNSIIVDMQKKSQEQQARIELLESGYSPSAAEELKLYGVPQMQGHQRPPRVYCDICELFDDHETEDCPLQAMDSQPTASSYSRSSRAAMTNRSYCEMCEIFGHCTEDCKEDQTF